METTLYKRSQQALVERINKAAPALVNETKTAELEALERATLAPGFWDDSTQAQAHMQALNGLKNDAERLTTWHSNLDDLSTLLELMDEAEASATL